MACYCIETGEEYAVKIVKIIFLANVCEEVRMLHECQGHPNIVSLVELLKDDKYIYIVTELIVGSELHDYKGTSVDDAKNLFNQLVDAVHFMHSKNIAHRDIKMENVLVSDSHPKIVTLLDFGFAARQRDDTLLTKTCFTLDYAPPEILVKVPYTRKCDVWSLGVILYILLCGVEPFRPDDESYIDDAKIMANIIKGTFTESYSWSKISNSAKDLIKRMLVVDPKDRLKIEDVMNHEWLVNFRKYYILPSTSTCSSYYTSNSTKALMNSRISELSDAYNEINENINNSNNLLICIDLDSNDSFEPIINNNNKEDTCNFTLNLSDDDENDKMFNDSVVSELWDEDFHGFDDFNEFKGFEISEIKMNNKLIDLIKNLSRPMYTTSMIGEKFKVDANVKTSKTTVKPKITTQVVKRNTRGRKVPIPIVIKDDSSSVPELKMKEEVRRTGRIRTPVITINPDDVLSWNDENEIKEVKPGKIRRGTKRRNEIDDRDWLTSRSKPTSKRKK